MNDERLIEEWLKANKVSKCPDRFVADSPQGARDTRASDMAAVERAVLKMHSEGYTTSLIEVRGGFYRADILRILDKHDRRPNRFTKLAVAPKDAHVSIEVKRLWATGKWPTRKALAEHLQISPKSVERMLKGQPTYRYKVLDLSVRQRNGRVIKGMLDGLTREQIANQEGIVVRTVSKIIRAWKSADEATRAFNFVVPK